MPFNEIIFTQDYHPKNHCSFKENGGEWPAHCVANTSGANIHKDIFKDITVPFRMLRKGFHDKADSYSAFSNSRLKVSFNLAKVLRNRQIEEVYICGLATDYCVEATVLSALVEKFKTNVIVDACRGVKLESSNKALLKMKESGAKFVVSKDISFFTEDENNPFDSEVANERDHMWFLAISSALGYDSGYMCPISPDEEAFKELFAEIRQRVEEKENLKTETYKNILEELAELLERMPKRKNSQRKSLGFFDNM